MFFSNYRFPLYTRSSPPPKQFLYAVFLLNQNITQLNFQINGIKCDLRATLPNLLQLLNGKSNDGNDSSQQRQQQQKHQENLIKSLPHENSFSSLNEFDHKQIGTTSNCSSVDLNNIPLPKEALMNNYSQPIDVVDMKQCDQR